MLQLFQMWAFIELAGIVCVPLTLVVFHNLPERGWAFAKTIGLVLFAFFTWCPLMWFHILPYDRLFTGCVAGVLLAGGVFGWVKSYREISKLVRSNIPYIVAAESIFLVMVFLLGWLRSFNPDIRSFEMFMDEGFIAAIMRSPHMPPNDMWFAGYSINYYYYAHYIIATIARLLGQTPSVAFNTGICMYFGLAAINLFGVTCNIVAWAQRSRSSLDEPSTDSDPAKSDMIQSTAPVASAGPATSEKQSTNHAAIPQLAFPECEWVNINGIDIPITSSDVYAEIELAAQHTHTGQLTPGQQLSVAQSVTTTTTLPQNVTTEPDMEAQEPYADEVLCEIAQPAANHVYPHLTRAIPFGLLSMVMGLILGNLAATQQWWMAHEGPDHFDWFAPSRVIPNTINEFPAFSFILSCFHAHVLTLAFTIVAIGLAFNLFLEADGKGLFAFGHGWQLPCTLGMAALIIGGLFVMNGWDYPTYLGLALIAITLQQWLSYERRFQLIMLVDIGSACLMLVALSFLCYLPFYLTFLSPSAGLGWVPANQRSPLADEALIYGLFGFIFISLLAISLWQRPLFEQNQSDKVKAGWQKPLIRNLLIAILLLMSFTIAALLLIPDSLTFVVMIDITLIGLVLTFYHIQDRGQAFTILLGTCAFALVAGCEVFFLRDTFADTMPRMNTVFKFYFQAWALLAITSGSGLYFLFERFWLVTAKKPLLRWLQRGGMVLWLATLLILLLASMVYPIFAPMARLAQMQPQNSSGSWSTHISLDGLTYLRDCRPPDNTLFPFCIYAVPGDYDAIRWINAHIAGDPVIVEATQNDYSLFGRISAFTGLPTLMGWSGHELQWRMSWLDDENNKAIFNNRFTDIDSIYTNTNKQVVLQLLRKYHAQYVYAGALERQQYPHTNLTRFRSFMDIVYSSPTVTIYKVRP